ncbi:SDR family NAD(P)-dependent oxidoreductase [Pedobacter lithocola]|uniref:SDR family NAD(P)-dependent oxidoreductase n=1 Tax=Pedobacter lithocola TaxID=1908239 RepID=A0ABV8PBA4_9SPHI
MSKKILITGASRGFGKLWAQGLLNNGHQVAVTARNVNDLDDLVHQYGDSVFPLQLDVNDRDACFLAINKVHEHFGAIDVLVNNAGYGLFGAIEETTEAQAHMQMETNFFGLLWLTQAVLPVMRAQKSGHIVQVSSILGLVTLPVLGLYNASKFAVEGLSETLASEVKDFGINVTMIEPNGFSTDWSGASSVQTDASETYEPLKKAFNESLTPDIWGKPEATVKAVVNMIESESPPLRLLLGKMAHPFITSVYEQRVKSWNDFKEISDAAHGA